MPVTRCFIPIPGLVMLILLCGCLSTPHPVTRAQASRLHAGMTYKDTVRVLGSKGEREAIPDNISQWKSDADGNKITVEYRKGQVFSLRFHYGVKQTKAESSALYTKFSRLKLGMSRPKVEKILGAPHDTVPISTDAHIYRWEMEPIGNTLVVKFKAGRLYKSRIDVWTPPTSKP